MMHLRQRFAVGVLIVAVAFGLAACGGQDGPDVEDLKAQLALDIPPYWKITDLRIEASENAGTEVDPDYRMRIRATAQLQDPTFMFVTQIETVTVLAPSLPKDHTVDVFGFAFARLYQEKWDISFEFQGDPFRGGGAPRSAYSGRTVLQDSAEHHAALKEIEDRRQAVLDAQRAAIDAANARWRDLLGRGEFQGQSSNGITIWPFEVSNVDLDANDRFTGVLTWPTLRSVHRVNGVISEGMMVFQNVEAIQRGDAALNCVYRLSLDSDSGGTGTYSRCAQGRVSITFDSEAVIAERRADRAAAIASARDAFINAAMTRGINDAPDGWGCASLPCSNRQITDFTFILERFDPQTSGFIGEIRWPSGNVLGIEGRLNGNEVAFRESEWRQNPNNSQRVLYGFFGSIVPTGVSGIACPSDGLDKPCSTPDQHDIRFSLTRD